MFAISVMSHNKQIMIIRYEKNKLNQINFNLMCHSSNGKE